MQAQVTINNTIVAVKADSSLQIHDTIDGRSTLEFVEEDITGTHDYASGQKVLVTDLDTGNILFTGYVNDVKKTTLYPNAANELDISCVDAHYLADKVFYAGPEYQNRQAGDIVTDLLRNTLAQEGITSAYAARNDQSTAQWREGVLSNTIAGTTNGGNLELAPAGTDFSTSLEFNQSTFNCLKFTGDYTDNYPQAVSMRQIWHGSMLITSGDNIYSNIWISSSTSPSITGGIELFFSDGTTFSDYQYFGPGSQNFTLPGTDGAGNDAQGIGPAPSNDLSGFANDVWYIRNHGVGTNVIGKTLVGIYLVLAGPPQGTKGGTYTVYFRRVRWWNSTTGLTKINLFQDTFTSIPNVATANTGFNNTSLTVVPARDKVIQNIFSVNLNPAKILKESLVTWANPAGAPSFTVEASLDQRSWFPCGAGAAIPCLLPGLNCSGPANFLYIRTTVTQGSAPDSAIQISALTISVWSAPQATKNDVIAGYVGTGFNGGTFTNTIINGVNALALPGTIIPYSTTYNAFTNYGSDGIAYLYKRTLAIDILGDAGTISVNKFAASDMPNMQNFTAEIDIAVAPDASDYFGLCYRTTNFGNSFGSSGAYAYFAGISSTGPILSKGSNTSSGTTDTVLANPSMSLSSGSTHRLKIVANGTSHTISVDEIPMISVTDSSFNLSGSFGLMCRTGSGNNPTGIFSNLGVIPGTNLSGTWVSPSINLASAGAYLSSYIAWDESGTPQSGSLVINASYDGGTTWLPCTNRAALPGTGSTLKLQVVMNAGNVSALPTLPGLLLVVNGYYYATGTRISPALPLDGVGRVGNTLVSWFATIPNANASILVETSQDDFAWSAAGSGAIGSTTIAGINGQPAPVIDAFTQNTSLNYSAQVGAGGAGGVTWAYDTAHSRLVASSTGSGRGGLFLYNFYAGQDTTAWIDTDMADGAGIVLSYVDPNNFYYMRIYDSAASTTPNTVTLTKWSYGTAYLLQSGTIDFPRGHVRRFIFEYYDGALTAKMDGLTICAYTDTFSPIGAGRAGLFLDNNTAHFYQFRLQGYGDDVTGKEVFSRITLSTSDPTASPQVYELSISAHDNSIQPGAFIPQTSCSIINGNKNTLAQTLDDLARQSNNFWWRIAGYKLYFQAHQSKPAAWVASNADIQVQNLQLETINDLYRNGQWINNGTDTLPVTDSFAGDDTSTTFHTGYPVDSITSITVNGVEQAVGVKDADTGKAWYYTRGDTAIVQDTSGVPLLKDPAQVMTTRAAGYLAQYAQASRTATFTTLREGLGVGELLTIFLDPLGVQDGWFIISELDTTLRKVFINGIPTQQAVYDVTAVSGPVVGDWTRFLTNLSLG
jgi:hypothetical protein